MMMMKKLFVFSKESETEDNMPGSNVSKGDEGKVLIQDKVEKNTQKRKKRQF